MQKLPIEIIANIVSNLDLEDRLTCRLVCQLLKNAVDYNIKQTNMIIFGMVCCSFSFLTSWGFNCQNYIQFKSNPSRKFMKFLVLKLPNVQIIYAHSDQANKLMKLRDLLIFSKTLRFFWCNDIQIPKDENETFKLMSKFTKLEAFKLHEYNQTYSLLMSQCLKLKMPLKHLKNPTNAQLDQAVNLRGFDELPSLISIVFDENTKNSSVSVPSIIARKLKVFSIRSTYVNVEGPLLNLRLLYLEAAMLNGRKMDNFFASSKLEELICFSCCERDENNYLPASFFDVAMRLDSFPFLSNIVFFNVRIEKENDRRLEVSLPPRIKKMTIKFLQEELPIDLITVTSNTLQGLECKNFATYNFNYPKIQKLSLKLYNSNEFSCKAFCNSLSSCVNLEDLSLILNEKFYSYTKLQLLIDTFKNFKNLTYLQIPTKNLSDKIKNNSNTLLVFNQLDMPKVIWFTFSLPVDFIFIPSEPGVFKISRFRSKYPPNRIFNVEYKVENSEKKGGKFIFYWPKNYFLPPSSSVKYTIQFID